MSELEYKNHQMLFKDAILAHQSGDILKAKESYEELLILDNTNIQVLCNLSVIYKNLKNYSKALMLLNQALAIDPKNILALQNLANLYKSIDAKDKAIEVLNFAIKIAPKNAHLYNELAIVHESMGDYIKAIDLYKKSIKTDPNFIKAYNNIGVIFYKQKRYRSACEIFKIAQKIVPNYAPTYLNLGASLNRVKRYEEAKEILEIAVKLEPNRSGPYTNLGNVLNKLEFHESALENHKRAVDLEPNSASVYANIAITYKNLTQFKKAKDSFLKAIEIKPNYVNAHFDYATLLLLCGEFESGFQEYEWRFKKSELANISEDILEKPLFKNSYKTDGKTLLIYGEQGFGDNIQFIRYVGLIKKIYPKMTLKIECKTELKSLFEKCDYIDIVVSRGEDIGEFDYQISVMSLPYFFKTDKKSIPSKTPYLKADKIELKVDIDMINIGLVWGGSNTNENHQNRVLSLEKFMPILNHPKIKVYSLQVGEDAKDIQKLGLENSQIIDLAPTLSDFSKTASVIKELDIIIASDTSVAHLAGALKKPIWVMLQKIPDWRWLMDRKSSLWYPSMKLFRQKVKGEWDSVYDDIFKALEKEYNIDLKERT